MALDMVTEAAHRVWLQQRACPVDLKNHLGISQASAQRLLTRLADLGVVITDPNQPRGGHWLPTPLPSHFFQKKGRSLYRRLTMYLRPKSGAKVVGVLDIYHPFLTHQQSGDWWLVCDHQGRIGYINVDALRFVRLD